MRSAEVGTRVVVLYGPYAGWHGVVVRQVPRTGEARVHLENGPERTYRLVSLRQLFGSEVTAPDRAGTV